MSGSLWNSDNVRDVGESVGLGHLSKEIIDGLARDVDYRLASVLDQAIKFMRKSKRTTLHTSDIAQALRALDLEPLFGYESTRPLRFGEASIGPGQPLYYVDDDEVDFEKLINAPLPKIPREISFTAHWLAIEGVQPSIPQNPTSSDSRNQEMLPKGPNANPNLAAASGLDSASVTPLVKHVLSAEIQLYFERVTTTILEERAEDARNAAYNSVRSDPGIHQLVPYFIQFIADKVTHQSKDLFVLTQMLNLSHAILQNKSLFIDPYIGAFVPSILTCLIGNHLGSPSDGLQAVIALRDQAASLLADLAKKHSKTSTTLKPRLARTLLKAFLDPSRSLAAHYGAIMALQLLLGSEGMRLAILPNLKEYDVLLREAREDPNKKEEAGMTIMALLRVITLASDEPTSRTLSNGVGGGDSLSDADKQIVMERAGGEIGSRIVSRPLLAKVFLDRDIPWS